MVQMAVKSTKVLQKQKKNQSRPAWIWPLSFLSAFTTETVERIPIDTNHLWIDYFRFGKITCSQRSEV